MATNNPNDRLEGWQRKLLDLSMRNVMLNLHPSKSVVALNENNPEKIIQLLQEHRLAEIVGKDKDERLDILKSLYRESRNALNENGTNTLYVSLGTLQWYEKDSTEPRIAPLLFIPLEIVRRKAMTYEIRMLDQDPMLNVTLLEMLRRDYGSEFPELSPIPMLEHEPEITDSTANYSAYPDQGIDLPDWERIFAAMAEHIMAINEYQPVERRWQMPMHSFIGLFSFSKFLMWHDINENELQVSAHPLLGNLNHSRQTINSAKPVDPAEVQLRPPHSLMLPIDYDSSQLAAVAEADRGSSFVLHGPPGTGKSQTITNIIANALFKGKRVLFVSEKKAALEVVQSRLDDIGLAPFCLELHSNKTRKNSFFAQLQNARFDLIKFAHQRVAAPDFYASRAQHLHDLTARLHALTLAVHQGRSFDAMSLYRFITEAGTYCGEALMLSDAEIDSISADTVGRLSDTIRQLDMVEQILGEPPSRSPLRGLYPFDNTIEAQSRLEETLRRMPAAIGNVRRKAASIINRWLMHRTPEEILDRHPDWQQLLALADLDIAPDIDSVESAVDRWNEATPRLRKWHHFVQRAAMLRLSAPSALAYYYGGFSGAATADAFAKGLFHGKALKAVNTDNRLRSFNGLLHLSTLDAYRQADSDFRKVANQALKEEMLNHLRSLSLSPAELKELALLERRVYNRGRGVSLRQIINDSRHVIHHFFPCMLMSPLSVAQFLDMEPDLFDIVIFDEASQMETPDAIGAIARGRQTIIVGDPKQLPPTNFFTASGSAAADEECQDAESILEDALAIGMPSLYLTRHYRSRHESLIAFSNHMFYDGKLLTFPSVNDAERKVTHIDPHGTYDFGKTRTNAIEAKAVVDYVVGRLESGPESIGIVCFSKAQSNLIDDLLSKALSRNRMAAQNLERAAEPIFVKNLENVQGDERDVIIFSVGYGPGKDGKVSLNFGPLNRQGGERRLNVAVTRAKHEMVVFSSLRPEHIPDDGDDNTQPKGVAALRAFIDYAIGGNLPKSGSGASAQSSDALVEQIAARLRLEGLQVDTNVGRSDFHVDLAVRDPERPGAYSLGVLLDGLSYAALPTVRDREITVPTVLANLGWRLHRIWALDWLEDPVYVVRSITNTL